MNCYQNRSNPESRTVATTLTQYWFDCEYAAAVAGGGQYAATPWQWPPVPPLADLTEPMGNRELLEWLRKDVQTKRNDEETPLLSVVLLEPLRNDLSIKDVNTILPTFLFITVEFSQRILVAMLKLANSLNWRSYSVGDDADS